MRAFTKHLPHYILLFGILMAGFIGLVIFSYDRNFQFAVATATSVAYVFWGIIHHLQHKDLHFEVVLEYVAVAILGLTVLFSLILR
jgi:hypothetical protein